MRVTACHPSEVGPLRPGLTTLLSPDDKGWFHVSLSSPPPIGAPSASYIDVSECQRSTSVSRAILDLNRCLSMPAALAGSR